MSLEATHGAFLRSNDGTRWFKRELARVAGLSGLEFVCKAGALGIEHPPGGYHLTQLGDEPLRVFFEQSFEGGSISVAMLLPLIKRLQEILVLHQSTPYRRYDDNKTALSFYEAVEDLVQGLTLAAFKREPVEFF